LDLLVFFAETATAAAPQTTIRAGLQSLRVFAAAESERWTKSLGDAAAIAVSRAVETSIEDANRPRDSSLSPTDL
jgi:hypothetical protein